MELPWIKNRRIRLTKKRLIILAIIAGVVLLVGLRKQSEQLVENEKSLPSVSLISVEEHTKDASRVLAQGEVESLAQVELRSEVSARITSIPVVLGQRIVAGQLLAYFDSAELGARLTQAQADLAVAEAGLASARAALRAQESQLRDIQNGGRPEQVAIARAQLETAEDALEVLYSGTENLIESIIASVENTIYTQIDVLFDDPNSTDPTLVFASTRQTNRYVAQGNRVTIGTMLPTWSNEVSAINGTDKESVQAALLEAKNNLRYIQDFLQVLTQVISEQVSLTDAEENTYTSTVAGARAAISAHLSTIDARQQQIDAQVLAVSQAQEQLALTIQGATSEQVESQASVVEQSNIGITAQEASVARARGVIAGIQAELAKRSIRSPISGTIATLPLRVGELVSPGSLVASVVNTTGLQVKAYIDSSNATSIALNAPALIADKIEGVVTTIAPSIDPTTRKVEVGVAVSQIDAPLVVGQFVDVSIQKNQETSNAILLPLRAINVSTEGSTVYTVSDNRIVPTPVTLGRVVGESVEVLTGLDNIDTIVSSVRGLKAGDEVQVR